MSTTTKWRCEINGADPHVDERVESATESGHPEAIAGRSEREGVEG